MANKRSFAGLRCALLSHGIRCALLLAALVSVPGERAVAQDVLADIYFDFRFDNREYKDSEVATSATYFGSRLTPSLGLTWGDHHHRLMAGVDLMADFGHKTFYTDPALTFYYDYADRHHRIYAGVFPRRKMVGEYSGAFFSDSTRFYDNNIDGLLLQYRGHRSYAEIGCDWNSMYSADRREKFMIFSAGQVRGSGESFLQAGYNFSMYHHAGSYTIDGVVDNILVYPYVGLSFVLRGPTKLSFRTGWLQAFQNDRKYVDKYVTPGGWQLEFEGTWRGLGLRNTLYLGDGLMPYYDSTLPGQPAYGSGLYAGESWYRTDSGIYDRLELSWQTMLGESVAMQVRSVHHYDGNRWGWQQVVALQVFL